jgi:hypothetical protein
MTEHVVGITRPEVSVSVKSDKQGFADHAQILELQGTQTGCEITIK